MEDINSGSEEVINNLVNDIIKDRGFTISKINIVKGSKTGDNYVGIIKKLTVEGTEENGKTSTLTYIVKQAPTDPKWRLIFSCEKCFFREMFMYEKVLPTFAKMEDDHRFTKKLKYPKVLAISKIHEAETIIMEDLTLEKFQMKNRREPLNFEHCKIVMQYFGQLHSYSFILKKEKPKLFEELSNLPETFFTGEFLKMYKEKKLEATFHRSSACLDENTEKPIINKLKTFYESFVENFNYCVDAKNCNGYSVICHGDCWMNNIFFKYEDENNKNEPSEVCFIDWQLSRHASPVTDIFYFIYLSTDKKLRDNYLNKLFDEYYTNLSTNLAKFNEKVEDHFPKAEFQRHIKIFSKFGLVIAMAILQAIMTDPKDAIGSSEIANNIEMLGEKMYKMALTDENFKGRMRGIIMEMYEKDYL